MSRLSAWRDSHSGAGLGYVKFQAQLVEAAQGGNNNAENAEAPVAFTNLIAQHCGRLLGTTPPKSINRHVGTRVRVVRVLFPPSC